MNLDLVMADDAFVAALSPYLNGCAWPVQAVVGQRPFSSVRALHKAVFSAVTDASDRPRCELIDLFPCSLPVEGDAPALSDDEESQPIAWSLLAARYRAGAGFGFVEGDPPEDEEALRRLVEERMENDEQEERLVALRDISKIVYERMDEKIVHAPQE